ncbi:hypothetical protein OPT61_g10002 [Boeremia exigua]|uniref:Uncharacterized protein n=1 Tax=Boeremia exigua TaxID=749465 RepID=A0ACC2HS82_9PLEO|nr:hypothetical protein OPT61_g10002 [Boeremia exigua]
MPPKIVYGKKAARPVSASYTTFLAPEKDALFAGTKTTEQKIQDELAALEAQLGGLAIEREGEGVRDGRSDGGQKSGKDKSSSTQKSAKDKSSRSRKALEDRDANAVSKKTSKSEKGQKEDVKASVLPQEPRTIPDTPPRMPIAQPKKRSRPTTSKKKAQLPTPDPTPERDDIYTQYVAPLLAYSDARRVTTFEQWSSELEPLFEITKIAEASFSEVYRLSAISAVTGLREESVLKVVALKTPPNAPLPCQTTERTVRDRDGQMAKELEEREEKNFYKSHVADVLSEVKLLQNLNCIPGFTNFRDLTMLQGRPSSSFSNAWKAWNKARPRGKKSYFPDPSKKTSYDDTQLPSGRSGTCSGACA